MYYDGTSEHVIEGLELCWDQQTTNILLLYIAVQLSTTSPRRLSGWWGARRLSGVNRQLTHFYCIFQYKDIYNFPQKAFERVVEGEEVESESESEREDGEKENELEEEMEEESVSTQKHVMR